MSQKLFWEPVKPRDGDSLSLVIRKAIERRYGLAHENFFNKEQVEWLRGIENSTEDQETKNDIESMLDAINAFGSIRLWLE